jgi:hypothetical protein
MLSNKEKIQLKQERLKSEFLVYWDRFFPDQLPSSDRSFALSSVPLTATQIVESIRSGKVTAEAVMLGYVHNALIAHQKTNCLTAMLFDRVRLC